MASAPAAGRRERLRRPLLAGAQALAGDRVDEGRLLEGLVAGQRAVGLEVGAAASATRGRPRLVGPASAARAWPGEPVDGGAQPVGHLVQRGRGDDEEAEEAEQEQQRTVP